MRHGWGLLHLISGIFVSALVLGICVPLFINAQRQAEAGARRARMVATARELMHAFQADVRQSAGAVPTDGGKGLRLTAPRTSGGAPGAVTYRSTPAGLVREQRGGGLTARAHYGRPGTRASFVGEGAAIRARFSFSERVRGRRLELVLECSALPRSAP